jgi:hypothetical protein
MQVQTGASGGTPAMTRGRKSDLLDLEVETDRLLMKVVEIGTLHEVEAELRKARRLLFMGMVARP